MHTTKQAIEYPVIITNVHEVTLHGTADLSFWREHLQREQFFPYAKDGLVQILISATEARWWGIPFRESSFSIAQSTRSDGSTHDGYYLAHAFNSVSAFAFVERTFFSTPYYPAELAVNAQLPARIQVRERGETVFNAQMASNTNASFRGEQWWEMPIYLPRRDSAKAGKMFYAKIGGMTEIFPFANGDTVDLSPRGQVSIFQWLVDSNFRGVEWHLRQSATHCKAKTIPVESNP
jgi:hypothetical protein